MKRRRVTDMPGYYGITSTEPNFVQVQYDISHETDRRRVHRLLMQNTFAFDTFSVYWGIYSEPLMEKLKKIKEEGKKRGVRIKMIPFAVPDDLLDDKMNEYNAKFQGLFSELQETIDRIESRLQNEEMYYDKKTKKKVPFTAEQIVQMIKAAEYLAEDLHLSIVRRREFEGEKAPMQLLNALESRIKHEKGYIQVLRQSNSKRKSRENKKRQPGQEQPLSPSAIKEGV